MAQEYSRRTGGAGSTRQPLTDSEHKEEIKKLMMLANGE